MAVLGLLWLALAVSPILILSYSEYHPAGPTSGWQQATLAEGAALYNWTRNRIVAWLVLYLSGAALLLVGRRRDPLGNKLRAFSGTIPGVIAVPIYTLVMLVLMTVANLADVLLIGMVIAVGFFSLWVVRGSGRALSEAVGRAILLTVSLLIFAVMGEIVMRTPTIAARTGGSIQDRIALRDSWERTTVPERHGLRWRSRHLFERKPRGVTRIFVLGDSFSFGDFIVSADALWPNLLEDFLNAQGRAVQVINSGTSGFDTMLERNLLEGIGWIYEPDIVVLQFCLNDAGPDPMAQSMPLLPIIGTTLKARSSLYQYLDVQFAALQSHIFRRQGWSSLYTNDAPGWRRVREAMRGIVADASARGVPVVLLVFPMFDSDLPDSGYRNLAAHQALASFAGELGIPIVDIRRRLAEIDPNPRSWWVRPFDAHPNEAAQRVAGEMMAVELKRLCSTSSVC